MALLRAREDSEPRPVTARASSGAPARAGRQLPIQNRRGSAGDHKDRTTAGRGSTQSHVIRLHEHSTTSRNVAIPTITIQALNQSRGITCDIGGRWETHPKQCGPTAQTPHHTQYHRPHNTHSAVEKPQRRRRRTHSAAQTQRDKLRRTPAPPAATTPTPCSTRSRFHISLPGTDTPRGRPGGRPLDISHQHSASSPR